VNSKEMFEKSGWKLEKKYNENFMFYRKVKGDECYYLEFYLDEKKYFVYGFDKEGIINYFLNVEEHLAIHEQMREFGWIE